jgi:hypothetical protein
LDEHSISKPDFSFGVKNKSAAAEFLGVSPRLVDQLAAEGQIQRYRLRGRTVFSTSELIEFLTANCMIGGAGYRNKPES